MKAEALIASLRKEIGETGFKAERETKPVLTPWNRASQLLDKFGHLVKPDPYIVDRGGYPKGLEYTSYTPDVLVKLNEGNMFYRLVQDSFSDHAGVIRAEVRFYEQFPHSVSGVLFVLTEGGNIVDAQRNLRQPSKAEEQDILEVIGFYEKKLEEQKNDTRSLRESLEDRYTPKHPPRA